MDRNANRFQQTIKDAKQSKLPRIVWTERLPRFMETPKAPKEASERK